MTTKRDIENQITYAQKHGMELGREEGEATKAQEIARNLKSLGVNLEQISTATGLSAEQIHALKSICLQPIIRKIKICVYLQC